MNNIFITSFLTFLSLGIVVYQLSHWITTRSVFASFVHSVDDQNEKCYEEADQSNSEKESLAKADQTFGTYRVINSDTGKGAF